MTDYEFHPEARVDLDDIWELIRADNLPAADRVIAEILAAVRALAPFPNRGHTRPDLTSRPLRFILVREYLIAYAPDEKPLWRDGVCSRVYFPVQLDLNRLRVPQTAAPPLGCIIC